MRLFLITLVGVMLMWPFTKANADEQKGSAYDYSFRTLIGEEKLPLSTYKGKVLLIVNTASQCGFTSQYEGLEKLYEQYKGQGLVILGVPSNDFGKQEPGSGAEIAHFCKLNYGVSFPMASKEAVSGDAAHPFYQWARDTLGFGTGPKWNFHKYLVNRDGKLVDHFNSTTSPSSDSIRDAVEAALKDTTQD
jgi:glutathione peroxidase